MYPTTSFLDKARALAARGVLAAAPLAALAPAAEAVVLTADYAAVRSFSNSGFFSSGFAPDMTSLQASTLPGGFKLSGSRTISDSLFWQYDESIPGSRPRFDTTGMIFLWGGEIQGATTWEDKLSAPYEFTVDVDFTSSISFYEDAQVSLALTIGYTTEAYHPITHPNDPFQQTTNPPSGNGNTEWFSIDTAGTHAFSGLLETGLFDSPADEAKYWYVYLTVDWQNEFVSNRWWSQDQGAYSLNGDELTLTVPTNSIDITYTAIPEPGAWGALFGGLALAGALAWRRRRRA